MLSKAAICYLRRKYLKEYPNGNYEVGALWYPSEQERRPCCNRVSQPSGVNRLSLKQHCLSLRHVASLYDVGELELRRLVHVLDAKGKVQRKLVRARREGYQKRTNKAAPKDMKTFIRTLIEGIKGRVIRKEIP